MPRIKDLGINIVPGTMRPPEIGGGGGCRRSMWMDCTQCTPDSGVAPTDDGCQCITGDDCGRITCGYSCRYNTRELETDDGCQCITGPTQPTDDGCHCVTSQGCGRWTCVRSACHASRTPNLTPHTPRLPAGTLSRDQIGALRAQLKQQLENLDAAEKNLLPKSLEELEAREKEVQRELDALKKHRDTLKKK